MKISFYKLFEPSLIVFGLILILYSDSISQPNIQSYTASISGKILDTQNIPVEFCTIALLYLDSTIVSGDISDEDGLFYSPYICII